ncbi:MAG: flagellar hook-length control protein FliK [Mariprofundales bacterium]
MKPGIATPPPPIAPGSTSITLRTVGNAQLPITPGQQAQVTVHRASNGVFSLTMQGKTVVIEGLPPTLRDGATILISAKGEGQTTSGFSWKLIRNGAMSASANTMPQTQPQGGKSSTTKQPENPEQALSSRHKQQDHNPTRRQISSQRPIALTLQDGKQALQHLASGTRLRGQVVSSQQHSAKLQLTTEARPSSPYQPQHQLTLQVERPLGMLQKNDTIHATIGRSTSGSAMLLLSNTQALDSNRPPAATSVKQSPPLRLQPGESTLGWVRERHKNGDATITLRGTSIRAPAPPTITTGDGLLLRMADTAGGRRPTLELIQRFPQLSSQLLTILKQQLPTATPIADSLHTIRSAISFTDRTADTTANRTGDKTLATNPSKPAAALESWLQRAIHNDQQPLTGARLASIIRDAGHLMEQKLRATLQQPQNVSALQQDLKTILSRLASTATTPQANTPVTHSALPSTPAANAAPPAPDGQVERQTVASHHAVQRAAEAAQQGVARIESGQLHNLLSTLHQEPVRLEFPMMAFNQLVTVQMSIGQPPEQSQHESHQEGQPYAILMALDLSHLGALRIDASISTQSVLARIHLANRAAAAFVQSHLPRVESRLQQAGFTQVQLLISDQPPGKEKAKQFLQLTTMVPAATSLLDMQG